MIEVLEEMPEGTIGFRATGHVTGDEYREVLLPAMKAAAEAGDVRMVSRRARVRSSRPARCRGTRGSVSTLGLGHRHAWKRTALVTDVEWIEGRCTCSPGWRRARSGASSSTSSTRPKAWVAG